MSSSTDKIPVPLLKPKCNQQLWLLDPQVVFLNHGSFGSCPRPVIEYQRELRAQLERQPVQFFVRDLEPLLDDARSSLAQFVGTEPENLVFVTNATSGVNTVLRSLTFAPGDELLVTDHEYNACRNALDYVASRSGASVRIARLPFPVEQAEQLIDPLLAKVTPRTKLVLVDHVTSQTGLVLPLERLLRELDNRGVDTLVDGAHAPGMLPLNLDALRPAYYTGNCHKWICAPKGAGFLFVRSDRQDPIRPLTISHGANSTRADRPRLWLEFDWAGTWDPTAWLSVPKALRVIGGLFPGGWREVMEHNHQLALAGRKILCEALQIPEPCPSEFLGSLASIPLPDAPNVGVPKSPLYADPLQEDLLAKFHIEVPVVPWPAPPKRLLRISAQLYNSIPQYELLAKALNQLL